MGIPSQPDIGQRARRAEALRARLLRRWIARMARHIANDFMQRLSRLNAESELRALDDRELHDLALDRGAIAHAARHGRLDA